MTRIHLFQRYSGKENVVTNNTLLLLRRLYSLSPVRLEGVLSQLFDTEVSIGVELEQQTRSHQSVPDGRLTQRGLEVVIETKVDAGLNAKQLERHLDAFEKNVGGHVQQFLLALTSRAPSDEFLASLRQTVAAFNRDAGTTIEVEATTFQALIETVAEHTPEYDYELQELLEDFEDYCAGEGLLPRDEFRLRAVPSGHSFQENLEYGVIYEPADRSMQKHRFLGLYTGKAIRAVGEVVKDVEASIENGSVTSLDGKQLTETDEARILKSFELALENRGWNVSGSRFTIVDRFIETEFRKDSKGGMRGQRYFDLGKLLGEDLGGIESIAEDLREVTWE